MRHHISEDELDELLIKNGLMRVPWSMNKKGILTLGMYQNNRTPIACVCLSCRHHTHPTLSNLKKGTQGACDAQCGLINQGNGIRTSQSEMRDKFLIAGVEMLQSYRNANSPTCSQCLTCKKLVYPTYANISRGQSACKYCTYRTKRYATHLEKHSWVHHAIPRWQYVQDHHFYVIMFQLRGRTVFKYGVGFIERIKEHTRNPDVTFIYLRQMSMDKTLIFEDAFIKMTEQNRVKQNLNYDPQYAIYGGGTECYYPSGRIYWLPDENNNLIAIPI